MQNLVIVESPTKAKMLTKYLGSKYLVTASMGHVRDLPKSDLGVDVKNNFQPKYIIPRDKTKKVNELKKMAQDAKVLWLATDPDREGEAIAWHIKELISSKFIVHGKKKYKQSMNTEPITMNNIHRVVFHEITPEAIKEAFDNPRNVDLKLVDAQQARRVLDRLVGYKLSPLLWKKIKGGLSAGRVQTVALRLIVEKEKEVLAFKPQEYWSIEADLQTAGPASSQPHSTSSPSTSLGVRAVNGAPRSLSPADTFIAALVELNGKKLSIKNKTEADIHVKALGVADYQVSKVTQKEVRKYPSPPFTTSTLQQASSLRLGLTAKKTMMIAQTLYEHGFITYMRTDSVNLSTQALDQIRGYIKKFLGPSYLPNSPKIYKTKSKVAQEAHEAIRPTNISVTSDKLKGIDGATRDHIRLYDLIWKKAVACQMNEAVLDQTTIDVLASQQLTVNSQQIKHLQADSCKLIADSYTLRATGSVVKFDGWMRIYQISNSKNQKDEEEMEEKDKLLPKLQEGEKLDLLKLLPEQHFTEPPARFNEASLIKKLEELGIGRPSTYAPILSTIMERFYVEKKERKFFPTELGITVITFLLKYFPDVFDYAFTADMEEHLDEVARGEIAWQPIIGEFYKPLEKKIEEVEETAQRMKIQTEEVDKNCPLCGKKLQIKFGKFGKFLACTGFPECKHTESLEEVVNAKCPDCKGEIVLRKTRKGRSFYGCKNWPNCKFASWTKPKFR